MPNIVLDIQKDGECITWRQLYDVIGNLRPDQIDADVAIMVNAEMYGMSQAIITEPADDETDIIGEEQLYLL